MLAIILSILLSTYITYEAVIYLKVLFLFKKNGVSKEVKIVDVAPNKKTNGMVPVVEIIKDDDQIVVSTMKSSAFSWWNDFDYKDKKIKVLYLLEDLTTCVRDSKREMFWIYFFTFLTYLFVAFSIINYFK